MRRVEVRIVANVVGEHAASERREQPDQILADEAAADDADGLSGQLPADELVPPAAPQRDVAFRHAMEQARSRTPASTPPPNGD